MKVAIFTCEYPPYPGGVATYTRELARALHRLGHEPVVHVFVDRGQLPDDGFPVVSLPPRTYAHAKQPILMWGAARSLMVRDYDMVFAADIETMIALAPIPTKTPKRAVVHGTDTRSRLLTKLFAPPLFKPLLSYEKIVANSRFTRGLLLDAHAYLPDANAKVALLGVSDYWAKAPEADETAALKRRLDVPDDQRVFASVGRIERRKGLHQAIAAIAALPKASRAQLTYAIVGRAVDEDYKREIMQMATDSGADIRFLGVIPTGEIRALYHRADTLLHLATSDDVRVEGFGLVIMEAAACGLPTLATRVDALPEVVSEGSTGRLVDDRDIQAMTATLADTLALPAGSKPLAEACRTAASAFTWERCARETFDLP